MLPVTHGAEFTRLHVFLYTLVLFAGDAAAVRLRHERLDLPGGGDRARRRVHRLRLAALARLFRRARAHAPSASRSSTCRCCSRRCWSTTTWAADRMSSSRRRFAAGSPALALLPAATGCAGASATPTFHVDRHHRRRVRAAGSRCPTSERQAAHARRLQGQGHGRLLRLHAVPRRLPDDDGRAGAGQEVARAPTATSCRACSSRSIRSATRRRS